MTRYLDLHAYLRIAAEVIGVEAEVLAISGDLTMADAALNACAAHYDSADFHPSFPVKAAVLVRRLCTGKPLPSHNQAVAYEAVREFAFRNGFTWTNPPGNHEGHYIAKLFRGVCEGTISDEQLAAWISERIGETE
jgi:hypothetical protein